MEDGAVKAGFFGTFRAGFIYVSPAVSQSPSPLSDSLLFISVMITVFRLTSVTPETFTANRNLSLLLSQF